MAVTTPSSPNLGRYELRSEIGRGGMAVVYRAFDKVLEREVALKLLHPHLASHVESRQRFQREARAVARLKHPSVLEIHDYSGNEGEEIYLVTEIVEGSTLRRFLEGRQGEPLSAEAAIMIARPVVAALAHAHQNGVIHRDVKPENILISSKGEIKLSDFGIAQLVGVSQMTTTGQILGSPAYMSPEHIEQADLDERADIFSVGSVLYEIAVGHPPFEGANPHAIIKRLVDGRYDDPIQARPSVGHHLAAIIKRCLELKPEDRYRSAEELVADLDEALEAVDVQNTEDELKSILKNPDTWGEKNRTGIINKTLKLGIAARRQRNLSEATNHFNRVLALDPGNDQALIAVAAMSRRRRFRFILERVAVAAAILIAAVATGSVLLRQEPQVGPTVVTAPPPARTDKKPDAGNPLPEPPAEPRAEPPAPKETAAEEPAPEPRTARVKRTQPAVSQEKTDREVVFTANPMAVEIKIDQEERFSFGPTNRKRRLEVGPHTVTFIPNDLIRFTQETWKVEIPPGDKPFQFRGRLRWRPASLLIESNVQTVVTIPGRVAGKTNKKFEVDIRNDIREGPEETITVQVIKQGYVPRTLPLTIRAGELVKATVNLVKEDSERNTSRTDNGKSSHASDD